jgi:hypothetical protein
MFEREILPDVHLLRWFFIPECIGLAIATGLTVLMSYGNVPPSIVLALWPTSAAALIDPTTFWSQLATGAFTFGGNFLLYGLIGWGVGYCVFKVRTLIKAD